VLLALDRDVEHADLDVQLVDAILLFLQFQEQPGDLLVQLDLLDLHVLDLDRQLIISVDQLLDVLLVLLQLNLELLDLLVLHLDLVDQQRVLLYQNHDFLDFQLILILQFLPFLLLAEDLLLQVLYLSLQVSDQRSQFLQFQFMVVLSINNR
jgi:hypothetical protein